MVDLYVPSSLQWTVLDLPPLRDCRACCPGIWIGASRTSRREIWNGAELFISRDASVPESAGSILREATLGFATTALADVPECYRGYVDRENSVDVEVSGAGFLESVTEDDLFAGANRAFLGSGEVIGFQDVEQIDDQTFRLTNLLRGRRGTEIFTGAHVAYEEFALLDLDRLLYLELNTSEIGALRYLKVVPAAGSAADVEWRAYTPGGSALRPFAPTHVTGVRNASDDVEIRWVPRSRALGRLLGPARLRACCCSDDIFEIEVLDGATVVRTIRVEGDRVATYTAVQQNADGLTPGNPVTIDLYEISSVVGRSFPRRAVL